MNGSPYESDIITMLIQGALENLQDKVGRKNILIIDDLDRIDPNHIFRLLNVFAAHFDHQNEGLKNKFGFDHILFVCDVNNIEAIYKNRYGIEVDFNGYIDKFYNHQIFKYDNSDNILSILDQIVDSIIIRGDSDGLSKIYEHTNGIKDSLKYILSHLITDVTHSMRSRMTFAF